MPSGYVEQAAVVSGWAAVVVDTLLSRHLPKYFAGLSPDDLAELKDLQRQVGRAARASGCANCLLALG